MRKDEELLSADQIVWLYYQGGAPEFESLYKLLDRAAEFGGNQVGAMSCSRAALDYRLTDQQHEELSIMMSTGTHNVFQMAARMGYNNVKNNL